MVRTLHLTLLVTALFAGSAAAPAQYTYSPYGDTSYARRDRAVFERARTDLDRAGNYPYASRSDRKRFDEARRDLFGFLARFDQGLYSKHDLDRAIDRFNDLVSHNSLDPRDRGSLSEDLRKMRDYRQFRDHPSYNSYRP